MDILVVRDNSCFSDNSSKIKSVESICIFVVVRFMSTSLDLYRRTKTAFCICTNVKERYGLERCDLGEKLRCKDLPAWVNFCGEACLNNLGSN